MILLLPLFDLAILYIMIFIIRRITFMNLIESAHKIYFKNISNILNLKETDGLTITTLYTELHHYCELMMRYLVVQKDPSKNLKNGTGMSVNAIELIDIIKNLYNVDFLSDNKINYNNFKSFFKKISNLRNSYAHAGELFDIKKTISDVLNDYIICFYVLNKDGDFINGYYDYLEPNITNKKNRLLIFSTSIKKNDSDISIDSLPTKANKSDILYEHIKDFLKLFSLSEYKKILFDIDNCFMTIQCPNCPKYINDPHSHQMTFVKTHKNSYIFKCYICDYCEKMMPVNCEKCFFDGIREPLSYSNNNTCLFCELSCEYALIKRYNVKNDLLENNIYNNHILSKELQIGIYHNSKNNYKNIHSMKKLNNVFKAYKKVDNNSVKLYLSYWQNFFSYKNSVHNYLNKSTNLNNYFPIFTDDISKKDLFKYTIREMNSILDYLISKTNDSSLINFINHILFKALIDIIANNIYSLNSTFKKNFKDDIFCILQNSRSYNI